MVQEVVRLTNIERAKVGSAPLQYHEGLGRAAMIRAKEINISFSHTRPDGRSSSTALSDAGVGGSASENIAMGYETPADAIAGWMNSSGHRAAMLTNTANYIGVGIYQNDYGTYFWTQEFSEGNLEKKCTLTVDANGGVFSDGKSIHTLTYPYNAYIRLTVDSNDVEHPIKDGYKFSGWTLDGDYVRAMRITTNYYTIKAIWEPIG